MFLLFRPTLSSDCILQIMGSLTIGDFFSFNIESAPQFTSKPPDPSFVLEGQNITLVWSYTLDGTFSFARFINVTINKYKEDPRSY